MFINTVLLICEDRARPSSNIYSGLSSSCFCNKIGNLWTDQWEEKKLNQVNVVRYAIVHKKDLNKVRKKIVLHLRQSPELTIIDLL